MLGTALAVGACKRRAFAQPCGWNFARLHGSAHAQQVSPPDQPRSALWAVQPSARAQQASPPDQPRSALWAVQPSARAQQVSPPDQSRSARWVVQPSAHAPIAIQQKK